MDDAFHLGDHHPRSLELGKEKEAWGWGGAVGFAPQLTAPLHHSSPQEQPLSTSALHR